MLTIDTNVAVPAARPAKRGTLFGKFLHMLAVRRTRNALGSLDDSMLKDIGLSSTTASKEAGRPIWDVPGGTWMPR